MNKIDIIQMTRDSFQRIENYMKDVDRMVHELPDDQLITPHFRTYKSPFYNNPHKRFAYATSVFLNESYIPSALVLGKNLRLLRHRYPLICMVQDKSYRIDKGGKIEYSHGVSADTIAHLLEIYDYVVGVDLLRVRNYRPSPYHFTNNASYSNILYYVSKGQVLGLLDFEKVMYLDASAYVENNLDSVFSKYSQSTFLSDREFQDSGVGIHGAFFMVMPNKYFYHKHMIFIDNYQKYFDDLYFIRGVDEVIIFFSVFPHWSNEHFDHHFACRKNKKKAFDDCDIYHFQFDKPFRNHDKNPMENVKKHYLYYDDWDRIVRILLKSHPHFDIYFRHIRTFRDTLF